MILIKKPRIGIPQKNLPKKMAVRLIIVTVFILLLLPFWTIFQDILTRGVMSIGWYRNIQEAIVPYELRVVGSVFMFLHVSIRVGQAYIEWTKPDGSNEVIYLIWNCVGWQTFILFTLTLITGLSGKHTVLSKIEAISIGILGTYLINIFRLVLVIGVFMLIGRPLGQVFHDYFSNILTISWLFFYWWFVFRFVLEESK